MSAGDEARRPSDPKMRGKTNEQEAKIHYRKALGHLHNAHEWLNLDPVKEASTDVTINNSLPELGSLKKAASTFVLGRQEKFKRLNFGGVNFEREKFSSKR